MDTLNENVEKFIEQVRIANQHCFGRKTETMQSIEGLLSFFDEANTLYDKDVREPESWTVEVQTVEVYVGRMGSIRINSALIHFHCRDPQYILSFTARTAVISIQQLIE